MGKDENRLNRHLILAVLFLPLLVTACTGVRLNTIPAPPPTAKLRVFVQPITESRDVTLGAGRSSPAPVSPEEFERNVLEMTRNMLSETGIYDVVKDEEVKSILGKQLPSESDWKEKDWLLARRVGKALHAEYSVLVARSWSRGQIYWEMAFLNVETGKKFGIYVRVPQRMSLPERKQLFRRFYREIFRDAKSDMLATAIRKGRVAGGISTAQVAPPVGKVEAAPSPPQVAREVDLEKIVQEETRVTDRTQLAVYDIDATEPFKIVALILSEALREEMFRLGRFTLVNRENIKHILNEMGLQETGLVDEKKAVQAGKGLAAGQIIIGQFGTMGKSSVLQAKRVDVETQRTLALSSLKCDLGKEDELLRHMGELAHKSAGTP